MKDILSQNDYYEKKVCACLVARSYLTLCNCSLPVSSVHGISQARILEWAAISTFLYMQCCAVSLSRVRLFVTPWTGAHQAPPSTGILQTRILEWVACPPPGDLPNSGTESRSSTLQEDSLPSEPPIRFFS